MRITLCSLDRGRVQDQTFFKISKGITLHWAPVSILYETGIPFKCSRVIDQSEFSFMICFVSIISGEFWILIVPIKNSLKLRSLMFWLLVLRLDLMNFLLNILSMSAVGWDLRISRACLRVSSAAWHALIALDRVKSHSRIMKVFTHLLSVSEKLVAKNDCGFPRITVFWKFVEDRS